MKEPTITENHYNKTKKAKFVESTHSGPVQRQNRISGTDVSTKVT